MSWLFNDGVWGNDIWEWIDRIYVNGIGLGRRGRDWEFGGVRCVRDG